VIWGEGRTRFPDGRAAIEKVKIPAPSQKTRQERSSLVCGGPRNTEIGCCRERLVPVVSAVWFPPSRKERAKDGAPSFGVVPRKPENLDRFSGRAIADQIDFTGIDVTSSTRPISFWTKGSA
jgi:hypothetical protein